MNNANKINEIQRVLVALIKAKFPTFDVVYGYPEADVFTQFDKPFLYVESPESVDTFQQAGTAGKKLRAYDVILGLWDDRKTGGPEWINYAGSGLFYFFDDRATCNAQKFTVKLDAGTQTDTTLFAQSILILDITGPRPIGTAVDLKEFRKELTLRLLA